MLNIRLSVGLISLSVFFTSTIQAEPLDWGSASGWDIKINSSSERACYATRVVEDGSEVQIGVDPTLKGGYLAIYNAAWTHLKEGDVAFVEFDFGASRFGGDVEVRFKNHVPGGYAFFNNPRFVEEFARRFDVRIVGSRGTEYGIDLTGTRKAIAEVLACQSGTDAQDGTQ
ncbi:MAG: hypothetical protein AAF636_14125 [Pseudomonadota bacterium]